MEPGEIASRYYSATGPFTYKAGIGTRDQVSVPTDDLETAVSLLSDGYLPTLLNAWGMIWDANNLLVLGWENKDPTQVMPSWGGTEEAFAFLYQLREYAEVVWWDLNAEARLADIVVPGAWRLPPARH